MTSDSTELTFVRCPSCRSLVPAVSTRCRMCGASLDTSVKSEDGADDDKKSGRVRQRTMSDRKTGFASAVSKLREESSSGAADEPVQSKGAGADDNGAAVDDPLSAYIEEVEDAPPQEQPKKAPPVPPAAASATTPQEQQPAREQGFEAKPMERQAPAAPPERKPAPASAPAPISAEGQGAPDAAQKPKVVVESGAWRGGGNRPSALSFSKNKEEEPQRQQQQPEAQPQQHAHGREERRDEPRPARQEPPAARPSPAQEARPAQVPPRQAEQPVQREKEREREAHDDRRDRQEPRRPQQQPERPREPAHGAHAARKGDKVEGRLIGWLVSYASADGESIELREGKFFVTGSSLKPSDLVIEDPSVSTPHALVTINSQVGVQLQDLMSERGIFIRTKDGDGYHRQEDTVRAQHGDWIRFGDVEYLVCIIAHIGVK